MRVTLLGTGSALPSRHRLQSGSLIEAGQRRLLVDCGSGITHRLAQVGVAVTDIETVLLTHTHLDHVADLPTLLKARWLNEEPELSILGPPGTAEVCDRLFALDGMAERAEPTVTELDLASTPWSVEGFDVTAVETEHARTCFAYRFDDRLVLSGDTTPTRAVFELADGVHTLVHECSFPDGTESDTHSTPSKLGAELADCSLEQIALTHLFPQTEPHAEELRRIVAEQTDAHVLVPDDRTTLTVSPAP